MSSKARVKKSTFGLTKLSGLIEREREREKKKEREKKEREREIVVIHIERSVTLSIPKTIFRKTKIT
jgi:hypothetical protein